MTISEAQAKGITKLRKPVWASKLDYLMVGPVWHQLYSPMNQSINGRDPVPLLGIMDNGTDSEWVEHTGPDADSDEYKAAAQQWNARERNQFGHPQPCGCRDCAVVSGDTPS